MEMKKIILILFAFISLSAQSQTIKDWFLARDYYRLGDSTVTFWYGDTLVNTEKVASMINDSISDNADTIYISGQNEWIGQNDTIHKVDTANWSYNVIQDSTWQYIKINDSLLYGGIIKFTGQSGSYVDSNTVQSDSLIVTSGGSDQAYIFRSGSYIYLTPVNSTRAFVIDGGSSTLGTNIRNNGYTLSLKGDTLFAENVNSKFQTLTTDTLLYNYAVKFTGASGSYIDSNTVITDTSIVNTYLDVNGNSDLNGILFTGSTKTAGAEYTGGTEPTNTNIKNYDGLFRATQFFVTNGLINTPNTQFNVGFGYHVFNATPTGESNIGIGYSALDVLSSGQSNIGIGRDALGSNTTGGYNIAIGQYSLTNNVSGQQNTSIGYVSLDNSTGDYNTSIGAASLQDNTSGSNNIGLGYYAGNNNTTFSNRLFVNSLIRSTIAGDTTNSIIYGYQDATRANQRLYLNANVNISEGLSIGGGDILTSSDTIDLKTAVEAETFEYIQLDTANESYSEGKLFYQKNTNALTFYNDISGFSHQPGYEFVRRVYNGTASTIPNGRAVRKIGTYKNGEIIASVALAGCSDKDSSYVYGIATIDIPAGSEGIVTRGGDVRNLNNPGLNDTIGYLGYAGEIIDTSPEAPNFSVKLCDIIYSDNDSGQVDVNISDPIYYPNPSFDAYFEDSLITITNPGTGVYAKITNTGNNALIEDINIGYTFQGDSVSPQQDGKYTVLIAPSFKGDAAQNDLWRIGLFVDNVKYRSISRTSSSTNHGGVPFPVTLDLTAGQWLSFRIANEDDGTRDAVLVDLFISITYIP